MRSSIGAYQLNVRCLLISIYLVKIKLSIHLFIFYVEELEIKIQFHDIQILQVMLSNTKLLLFFLTLHPEIYPLLMFSLQLLEKKDFKLDMVLAIILMQLLNHGKIILICTPILLLNYQKL